MTKIEGGCLCGAVRYMATAQPAAVRECWCRVCQYFACGNSTINLAFPTEAVTITGDLRDYPNTADSGNRMHRRFCPQCGVHLFTAAEARPHIIGIRAGTLDDPGIAVVDSVIWTSSAPAWAKFNPDVPRFEKQAPAPVVK